MGTAFTLSDSRIETIVRTIMPDLYLMQNYLDNYVCECPEDYEDETLAGDEESSQVAAALGADYSN